MTPKSLEGARLKVYLKNYSFTPKWSFLVGTVILAALFVWLGFWQLSRAEEKRVLQQQFDARMHAAAIELPLSQHVSKESHFLPVKLKGAYDNAHAFILDNKIQNHQVGYEVVVPFSLDAGQMVLVNRGWIPAMVDRSRLPEVPAALGVKSLTGFIYVPTGKPFTLGDPYALAQQNTWPLLVEALEVPAAQKILKHPLYPYIILLNAKDPTCFGCEWQPVSFPPARHIGYAVQWFTFAAVLIIIFFALNFHRR